MCYGNEYGVKVLQRDAVAALLHVSNPNVNFKYSVDNIIWKVRTAYVTEMYQFYADCLIDVISVVKIDSVQHAVEGGRNGYVRLLRDNTSGTLTVYYTMDAGNSTAILGTDISPLPGTLPWGVDGFVTFQNGESYVDIPVEAVNNRTAEPDKSVVLRILAAEFGGWKT
jgi:hypothetical protein